MALYCFRCPECGERVETPVREPAPSCSSHQLYMARDYAAEGFGVGAGVRVSKTGTDRDAADLFLPHARDFAGPGDPDGGKGLRDWNESHGPRAGNRNPKRPEAPPNSKVFL